MGLGTLGHLVGLMAISFSAAFAVLALLARMDRRPNRYAETSPDKANYVVTFLFEDELLVNASPLAQSLLGSEDLEGADWSKLKDLLLPQFPNFREELDANRDETEFVLDSVDGVSRLEGQRTNGLLKISLHEFGDTNSDVRLDQKHYDAMQHELDTLRCAAGTAPVLVWRQKNDGTISWANRSYLILAKKHAAENSNSWPPCHLFECRNSSPASQMDSLRITTTIAGEVEQRWFECFETSLGDDSLFTAVPADKVIKAETALNEFVQTLTKTFAHLKIGLAVFDKQRQLALFNPALLELTALSPEFLSSRPMLHAVLDRLRDNQVLPEPKNYKSWRRRIYDLESAAVNGTYEEIWSLANGRTYKVNGQPHPDGALAFLIEDISAEISLTRRFRSELDMGQAVLDSLPEAIVVFSSTGSMTISNAPYRRLWGIGTDNIFEDQDIQSACQLWKSKSSETAVWDDARAFCGSVSQRNDWTADIRLLDGQKLRCRFMPLGGGATLAGFTVLQSTGACKINSDRENSANSKIVPVTA